MGAGRGRLVRQMLVESLTLALAGGAAAVVLAWWLVGVIAGFQPPLPIDIGLDIAPDWRVLVFTLGVAALTGVLFGLVPALQASRPDLVPALKGGGERDGRGGRRRELRDALVVVQVAVSVVLLVTGALLTRSFAAGSRVDMGYDMDRIAYLSLPMEMNGYGPEEAVVLLESGKQRLESLQEVERVGVASRTPLSLNNNGYGMFIPGRQSSREDAPYRIEGASVDEDYFRALGLEIVAGRGIEFEDREQQRRVVVLTRSAATRFWPGEDALGQEFRLSWEGTPFEVVGIVEDYKVNTPGEAPTPYLHLPLPRSAMFANYVVRTRAPAAGLVRQFERELRVLDADLVFLETGALRSQADVRLFPIRAGAWLIGAFGVLALLMAAVGLYGVISYSVSRRVREIGVRKALGASTGSVIAMVFRQGMGLVIVGGVVGGVVAALGARALSGVLFVEAFDPASFAVALGSLVTVAALANWIPARRAAGVEPMVALRSE
jgi:predicted permease